MILRPIQISIRICGWRLDRLVLDLIKIGCTGSPTLWVTCNVSTVGSNQSVSSTQSKEIVALQQHTAHLIEKYKQLSTNYEQLRKMLMKITSQMDDTCVPSFLSFRPGNDQPSPPPPSPPALPLFQFNYFFWKHIKCIMNIWMNII